VLFDELKFYSAAFIVGILVGALAYRELEKRFFRERSTPLSKVIDQSIIRNNVKSLYNLIDELTETLSQIQEETEKIFSQMEKIADVEEEIIEEVIIEEEKIEEEYTSIS
jgi:hypothetical protein